MRWFSRWPKVLMRSRMLLLVVFFGVVLSSQDAELIPAPYLAAEYTAPIGASSNLVIAGRDEPGERLVVTGRVLDGVQPVVGASLYVFHTDIEGRYSRDVTGPDGELSPRLHGVLSTDAEGRYRYETVRPGSYNNNAAHVHYVVKALGFKPRLLDLWFDDDPVLLRRRQVGEPDVPSAIRDSSVCRSRPDCVVISPVSRDASGVWRAARDIQMVRL